MSPNEYEVNSTARRKTLISNGFVERDDYYKTTKQLYGNHIRLILLIGKDMESIVINVQDNNGEIYAPFYNPDLRHNNLVCDKVIATYNKLMDKLCAKNILKRTKEYQMTDKKTIKIKYFNDKLTRLEKIDKGDWIDLRAAETVKMKKGEFKLISLGIAMELPEGYEAHVVPRSSTFKNFHIIQTNHQGVIDESYKGPQDCWFFPAYALEDTVINMNDRICQFRIEEKQPQIEFEEVKELGNANRGGHGSTGVK